jgi:hypothetical protein
MTDGQSNKTSVIIAVITLIGGATTALIANWDKIFKKNEKPVVVVKNTDQPSLNKEATVGKKINYTGKVGKWPTTYELTWNEDGSIEGTYQYYERKTNDFYELKGKKTNESSIELREYINGRETATALLTINGNCYTGKIKNKENVNSGKMFDMSICK